MVKLFQSFLIGMLTVLFSQSCEYDEDRELAAKDQVFQSKQDSIQQVIESLRHREEANKKLIENVRKTCDYQLLQLENGSVADSMRLRNFIIEMKDLYPQSERDVLRRIAMDIESCEEYRHKISKRRKK